MKKRNTKGFTVRLTEEEKEAIQSLANKFGLSCRGKGSITKLSRAIADKKILLIDRQYFD
jgi:predicted ATPase with chaperone activity